MTPGIALPKLWLSMPNYSGIADQFAGSQECVCDCACPNPLDFDGAQVQTLTQQVSVGDIQDVRVSGDVHLDHIKDYTVALSATGAHIVALDGPADCLFSYLDTVSSVQALRQVAPWPNGVTEQVIALLLAVGILSSPQKRRLSAVQDSSTTLTAWLHLTNRCDLCCQYCYVTRNGQQADLATARRAVDAIYRSALAHGYSCVKLKYAGGEPTLNLEALWAAQQRAEVLSAQTNISLETVMLTNGVHLKDDQIDALLTHNIRVMVSLDGMGEYQDIQRPSAGQNRSSFECVSRTLDRLLERGIYPHVSTTITRQNIEGLPGLVEYLLDQGLRFSLNFYREPDDLAIYRELSFTPDEIIAGLRSVFDLIESRLPRYSLLSNLSDRADLRMPHSHTCSVGRHYIVVDCDGNIAKCQMDMAHPVTTINADDPLVFVQADTDGIQNLAVDERECRECIWRYRCAGGCPRLTFQRTGRYDARSPLCEVYQAILPEVVRLEALRLIRYEEPWNFHNTDQ
jgi:uncharacterized protein